MSNQIEVRKGFIDWLKRTQLQDFKESRIERAKRGIRGGGWHYQPYILIPTDFAGGADSCKMQIVRDERGKIESIILTRIEFGDEYE